MNSTDKNIAVRQKTNDHEFPKHSNGNDIKSDMSYVMIW